MCRRQHLLGCIMVGFGLGLLIGRCLESGFLCTFGGIGLVVFGFCCMRRK